MAVTITPEELYFGSPTTLTYGGVDIGGTTEPPTLHIEITENHPDFQNAAGPIVGTSVITDILVWALPGATEVGGVITWEAGRVPSSAYKDLVLVGQGLDGRTMTVTLENAFSSENLSIPFSKTDWGGLNMNFVGYYDSTTPLEAPFSVQFSEGS
jgi:hypothetical protein